MWLKIKVWTKVILFGLLALAVLVFLINNVNKPVTIWLWNDYTTTLLRFAFVTVLVSVIGTILVGTTFKTIRQVRELRSRARTDKLERDLADMKSKASMLQTKPKPIGAVPPQEMPE
jgi:uncharacterized membrane protein